MGFSFGFFCEGLGLTLTLVILFVMPGLDPGIHVFGYRGGATWMAGTSPAMTMKGTKTDTSTAP
jgi:hypothetical protein